MLFKKSSWYPLINCISDVLNQKSSSCFIFFNSSLDSFEEELNEAFKRILIHMINDAKRNTQEIKHSALSSNWTIDLSLSVNINFSNFCNFWLFLNFICCSFSFLQVINKLFVIQNCCWISFWKLFQQWWFKFI